MHIPRFHRKPFLIGVSGFSLILLIHLIGIYIFDGGKYIGLPGGSISIGVVGKTPNIMDPLSFGENSASDLMFRFLFRGLITYNPRGEISEGDLATCDLSNLAKVTCELKNGMKWSDKTLVKEDDVIATFQAFRDTAKNGKMQNFLQGVSIVSNKRTITFQTKEKNPLILELLTYPVIRSDMVEQIRTGRFSSGNYITSGPFRFSDAAPDAEYGFDRITLVRNEFYNNQISWLDKVHFKFFPDLSSLERSTDTLSIIIPPVKNEKLLLSARFYPYKYATYEFFGVFFHTDKLSKNLRNSLHWQIGTSFSGTINNEHRSVESIFSGGKKILPTGTLGNFPDILRKNGYLRKDEILANIDKIQTTVTGGVVYEKPRFFQNEESSLILFTSEGSGGILLRGIVPPRTSSVSINNYTLREFTSGSSKFAYRISPENGNLAEGKNTYELRFGTGDTTIQEILTIYYSPDTSLLTKIKNGIDATYLERLNTPALIADRERKKQVERAKVEGLNDHYYYNEKYEPFKLTVAYIVGPQSTEQYAKAIEGTLKKLSIIAELIPLESKDLEEIIKTGKKNYDILVAGVGTSGNIAELGQLFSSEEAGKGVNFANIESKTLDDLFATLRSTTLSGSVQKAKSDIIQFMQDESFFFPISSPLHIIYVDRNLKGVEKIDTFPDITTLYDILKYTSIRDTYILNTEGKGISGFFDWFFSKVSNE